MGPVCWRDVGRTGGGCNSSGSKGSETHEKTVCPFTRFCGITVPTLTVPTTDSHAVKCFWFPLLPNEDIPQSARPTSPSTPSKESSVNVGPTVSDGTGFVQHDEEAAEQRISKVGVLLQPGTAQQYLELRWTRLKEAAISVGVLDFFPCITPRRLETYEDDTPGYEAGQQCWAVFVDHMTPQVQSFAMILAYDSTWPVSVSLRSDHPDPQGEWINPIPGHYPSTRQQTGGTTLRRFMLGQR